VIVVSKYFVLGLLAVVLVSAVHADVIFTTNDKMSMNVWLANTAFSSGTQIGVDLGLNNVVELDLLYAAISEGGIDVSMIIPGIQYYLLKPSENNIWFVSVHGDYFIVNATTGAQQQTANGYYLGGNVGFDWRILPGYKIMPYVGLLKTSYEVGSSKVDRTDPKIGSYIGVPLGPDNIVYLKPSVTFMANDTRTNVEVGYQFALSR
jgi:hypothetical protein